MAAAPAGIGRSPVALYLDTLRGALSGSLHSHAVAHVPDIEQVVDTGGLASLRANGLDVLRVSQAEMRANFERYGLLDEQVHFLEGWFKDTLPTVRDRTWSVVRLDGDMYESTMDGLVNLDPGLSAGRSA